MCLAVSGSCVTLLELVVKPCWLTETHLLGCCLECDRRSQ